MKKILLMFICILSFYGIGMTAHAETVRVEGENYSSVNFSGGYKLGNQNLSGKKAFYSSISITENESCTIEYSVTVAQDGVYNVKGITSLCYADYTTAFYIRVNDDEIMNPANNVIERYDWMISGRNDYMALQDFGHIYLHEGENKFEVVYRMDDPHITESKYVVILDCFDFTYTEGKFAVKNITAKTTASNVFLKMGNDVVFDIEFTTVADKKTKIPFTITDIYGKEKRGSILLAKGQKKYTLNLGPMFTGWYKMTFSDIDIGNIINPVLFSVLPSPTRNENDTPFGVDKYRGSLDVATKLYNAAGMAGFSVVRVNTDPYLGQNENYFETHEDMIREAERDSGLTAMQVYEHLGISYSRKAPDNLLDAYEMNRNFAEHYKGLGYYYEIWNEEDAHFFEQPADIFSAFFKASAIGISDGDSEALKMPGGYGAAPETLFTRLMLRNNVTDYADIYAYHNHSTAGTGKTYNRFIESVARKHTETALAYNPQQPIWVTEAGLSMAVSENDVPDDKTLLSQARYYVVSTVEQLAYGAQKSFWFRLEHFMENGREWGSFNASNQPYPVINSVRTLTDKLKKGIYKGSLDTDTDVLGYMFNDGTNDVAVVWSDTDKRCQLYTDYAVTVTDIFGKARKYTPCDMPGGKIVNIPVSYYPVFIEFVGESDSVNYFKKITFEKVTKAKTYSRADRIITDQRWEEQDEHSSKQTGYPLENGDVQKVSVYIYNLNDTEESGTIEVSGGSAAGDVEILDINDISHEFTLPPMSRKRVEIEVSLNDMAEPGELGFLKISGSLNTGEKISDSISAFCVTGEREVSDVDIFDDYNNCNNWNLDNHGAGLSVSASSPDNDTVRFDVFSKNPDVYYWPTYTVKNYVTDEDGICFRIRSTHGNIQDVNVYAYATDGSYWLGHAYAISYDGEWKQICIPWHKFITFQSGDYQGAFDPSRIRKIGIGSYAPEGTSSFEIKDLGWYHSQSSADVSDSGKTIYIRGIEDGKTYQRNHRFIVEANVDTDSYIIIRLGDKYIDNYTLSDGKVLLNFEITERGEYDLQIINTDKWNYKNSASVHFKVR